MKPDSQRERFMTVEMNLVAPFNIPPYLKLHGLPREGNTDFTAISNQSRWITSPPGDGFSRDGVTGDFPSRINDLFNAEASAVAEIVVTAFGFF